MGKYEIQWWYFSAMKWMPDKTFIFQRRALKYISKRIVDKSYARKWRIVDTAYAAPVTRIVCEIERVKAGD